MYIDLTTFNESALEDIFDSLQADRYSSSSKGESDQSQDKLYQWSGDAFKLGALQEILCLDQIEK